MNENKFFEALGHPFPAKDVSWRLQYVDKEKMAGFAVPYLDARAISDRLDAVVGQMRWKDTYSQWHQCIVDKRERSSQLCTISIYDDELKEWIEKTDGAEDSDIEPIKGGLSDAFKRAAVKWNIGRYLYGFSPVWVKAVQRGNSYAIEGSEQTKLEDAYNRTVATLFGKAPEDPKMTETIDPKGNPGQPNPRQQNNGQHTPATGNNGRPEQAPISPVYEVKAVNVQNGENGRNSVITFTGNGREYKAFVKGVDDRLQSGARITNLKAQHVENSYGKFIVLNDYEMAAA